MEKHQKAYLRDINRAANLIHLGITQNVQEALDIVDGTFEISALPLLFKVIYKISDTKDFRTMKDKINGHQK